MPQLVIPDIEEAVLQRLRERATAHGTTAEAEARVVLSEALEARFSAPIESAHQALDIFARLAELKPLKDGWLDGSGLAPAPGALDWLASAFQKFYTHDLPPPHLYPTAVGGVRAEWSPGPYEASLEIGLPDHTAEWNSLNLDTDQTELRPLNLDSQDDWACCWTRSATCIRGWQYQGATKA